MLVLCVLASGVRAQQTFWVQVEAQPTVNEARERARDYAARLPDVNGFALSRNWFGIALGPYDEDTARTVLEELRRTGRVPRDSYVAGSEIYGTQFWPPDAAGLRLSPIVPDLPQSDARPAIDTAPAPPPDETLRQAQASEARLDLAEREALQIALEWAGYYAAAIDGAFGRGTRAAMANWQRDNGFEPTGVLTTRQRAALLGQYNALLDGVGLERVADPQTGIEMLVPTGLVAFDGYESPFARYLARDGSDFALIQVSRPGDQNALFGLYDILQTLEIVPREGARERRADGFSITGESAQFVSQTEVVLRDGAIKGYILVWPTGDETRRTRVLAEIAASFRSTDGVLPLDAGNAAAQSLDLVSGLPVRRPIRARSGFFVDAQGRVLTAADAVAGCGSVTLDRRHDARVAAVDPDLGVALLAPVRVLAPAEVARLAARPGRLRSDIAVAGYSFEGALGAPSLTRGTLADVTGLRGEETRDRLQVDALPGDVGGPVLDAAGEVIGLLLPPDTGGRDLPTGVGFSVDAAVLPDWLAGQGVTARRGQGGAPLSPAALTQRATALTVLVTCWE